MNPNGSEVYYFLNPQRLLESSVLPDSAPLFHPSAPARTPPHPSLPLPSPGSDSSSFSLFSFPSFLDSIPEPCGGNLSVRFSGARDPSFLAQVGSVLRGDLLGGLRGPRRLCLVCGDLASGFHYGVASCEACKAFFKRTVQGNMEYVCPMTKQCEITKRRRKACQACRFHKCLQAGMLREGVRMDRVRGGRQKYRRRESPHTHTATDRNQIVSQLLLADPAPSAANQEGLSNQSSFQTLLALCDLLNRELLLLVGWAKSIPGFPALSLVDQMSLLQSGWMEALLVGVAWRSQAGGAELVFAGNLRLDGERCRATGLADLFTEMSHLTGKYRTMKINQEEALTLKALALANADTETLESPDSVQSFQDLLHEALQDYQALRGPAEPHRAGKLLMTLPLLRQAAERGVLDLLRLQRQRRLPLPKLLLEMLEAKC